MKNIYFDNVVLMFPFNLLAHNKPGVRDAENVYQMSYELNTDLLDWNLVTVDHVFFKIMTLFWDSIVNEFSNRRKNSEIA